MELINKKDAIHAVLHNQGDAAVAAVQNIKPINPHGELSEMMIKDGRRMTNAELIKSVPSCCPYCGERGINLRTDDVEMTIRGVHFKYAEIVAECFVCKEEIYVPFINDYNCKSREYAYATAKAAAKAREE